MALVNNSDGRHGGGCSTGDEYVLFTIPFSHYNEHARWAMHSCEACEEGADASFGSFTERAYLVGIHAMSALSPIPELRARARAKNLTETPLLARVKRSSLGWWNTSEDLEVVAINSWEVASKAANIRRVEPVSDNLKELLDNVVGPAARTIVYSHLLKDDAGDAAMCVFCLAPEISWWQRLLFSIKPFREQVRQRIHKGLVRSDAYVEKKRIQLDEALKELERMVDTQTHTFGIAEDGKPTPALIALASVTAPLVCPPEFSIPFYGRNVFDLQGLPPLMREDVLRYRETRIGQVCMETYRKHRLDYATPCTGKL